LRDRNGGKHCDHKRDGTNEEFWHGRLHGGPGDFSPFTEPIKRAIAPAYVSANGTPAMFVPTRTEICTQAGRNCARVASVSNFDTRPVATAASAALTISA
jgi:hypothetical protein